MTDEMSRDAIGEGFMFKVGFYVVIDECEGDVRKAFTDIVHIPIHDRKIESDDGVDKTWKKMVYVVAQIEPTFVGRLFPVL